MEKVIGLKLPQEDSNSASNTLHANNWRPEREVDSNSASNTLHANNWWLEHEVAF
jgi:hypothetical protein